MPPRIWNQGKAHAEYLKRRADLLRVMVRSSKQHITKKQSEQSSLCDLITLNLSRAFDLGYEEGVHQARVAAPIQYEQHRNLWMEMVAHRGCISPCRGRPMLEYRPSIVSVEAGTMPAYLKCSECGYTPLSNLQPQLVMRFLKYWLADRHQQRRRNSAAP